MGIYQLRCLLLLFFILSCKQDSSTRQEVANGQKTISSTTPKLLIWMQPFGDISSIEVLELKHKLSKHFDSVVILKHVKFPLSAYVKERNRYRADSLLNYLKCSYVGHGYQLGISAKDISTKKGQYKDWGIMGLSFCPGRQSVISTFRLEKSSRSEQLYKVAVHELGHAFGLPHCKEPSCYMRDAEGRNPLHEEVCFCSHCKSYLVTKGWIL